MDGYSFLPAPTPGCSSKEGGMSPAGGKNACQMADELYLSQRPLCFEQFCSLAVIASTRYQFRHQATSFSCGHLSFAVSSINGISHQARDATPTPCSVVFLGVAPQLVLLTARVRGEDIPIAYGATDSPHGTAVMTSRQSL